MISKYLTFLGTMPSNSRPKPPVRVRDEQDLAPVDVFSGRVQGASAPVIPMTAVDIRAAAAHSGPKIQIIDFCGPHLTPLRFAFFLSAAGSALA
ncbi:MAG: hypothetical protein ABI868_24310 [Acidobacteriota bacterium]